MCSETVCAELILSSQGVGGMEEGRAVVRPASAARWSVPARGAVSEVDTDEEYVLCRLFAQVLHCVALCRGCVH